MIVRVPFDRSLLRRLARGAALSRNRELAFAAGRSLLLPSGLRASIPTRLPLDKPTEVLVGGTRYVAVSTLLTREAPATRLVALAPADEILAGAGATRLRLLLASLGALAAVALAAYALAPLLGRSRLARQQRDRAARVLSHLGEGVFLVDSTGVIRLWNPTAAISLRRPAEDAVGRPIAELLGGWASLQSRIPVASEHQAGGGSRAQTLPVEVQGEERWLSISAVT